MATLHGKPLMSYRVVDLKEELQKRGLSKNGAKKDLVERLEQYILEHEIDDVVAAENSEGSGDGVADPPSMQIEANLEENDIVREYMMMRQSQFKSTKEEAELTKKSSSGSQDEEDEPLLKRRDTSPRKRRGRGAEAAASTSESEEGAKSPEKAVRGAGSPAKLVIPPEIPEEPLTSPKKRVVSPQKEVSAPQQEATSPQKEAPISKKEVTASQKEAPISKKEVTSPQKEVTSPQKEVTSPQKEVTSPQKEVTSPQKEATTPKKEVTTLQKETELAAEVPAMKVKSPVKDSKIDAKSPLKEVKSPVKESPIIEPTKSSPVKQALKEVKAVEESKSSNLPVEKSNVVSKEAAPLVKEKIREPESEAVDEIVVSEPVTFDKDEDNSNESPSIEKEPITFRKLSRLASNNGDSRKKRTWGESKKSKGDLPSTVSVSSSELKDIIPDIKPVLEELKNEAAEAEQKMEAEESPRELPKPTVDDPQEIQEKLAPVAEKNKNHSKVIEIRNLVRPFTNNQLISLLKRTGNFDESSDFWIDKIKSHALVKYQSPSEAEETVLALDGVKWPSSNQKKLIVTFSSDEHFDEQSKEAVSLSKAPAVHETENSKKRSHQEMEEPQQERKRPRKESEKAEEPKPKKEQKSLEVLFNKTKALPSIYWMPRKTS